MSAGKKLHQIWYLTVHCLCNKYTIKRADIKFPHCPTIYYSQLSRNVLIIWGRCNLKRSRRTVIFVQFPKYLLQRIISRILQTFLYWNRGRQPLHSAVIHRYNCSKNTKGNALYLVGGINFYEFSPVIKQISTYTSQDVTWDAREAFQLLPTPLLCSQTSHDFQKTYIISTKCLAYTTDYFSINVLNWKDNPIGTYEVSAAGGLLT